MIRALGCYASMEFDICNFW